VTADRATNSEVPDISISIVSYNTASLLRACVLSLLARESEGEASLEIIVADNGSTDGSCEMVKDEFPSVILVETGGNIGYGRGNNAALHVAHGRYYFILNSDTEVEPGALGSMKSFMDENPTIGMLGAQLILPDRSTQASCARDPKLSAILWEQTYLDKLLPKNRVTGSYLMTDWDYGSRREVEQVCGACFFVRAEAFQQIGGFDPAYFMYFEDTDFCVRLRREGWPIWFFPDARILHHLGASSSKDWRIRALMVASYNQSRYYYFRRNYGRLEAITVKVLTLLGAALRLSMWSAIALVRPSSRDQVKLFADVWKRTLIMKDSGAG
jgi:N-acetylglucosaminyl-diphospho-decaprenol L-rhamnosyltransferase